MAPDESSALPQLPDGEAAKLILEHAKDYGIFLLGLDGRVLTWSAGAQRITGYTAEEAIGMDFGVIFTPSDRAAGSDQAELQRAWRDGRAEDSRWHLRKDGVRFWANGVTTALHNGEAKVLIKVMRDETRARRADEQRVLLLNELNHRINNTLVTVQSMVEQTLRSRDIDDEVREDLTRRLQALSQAHRALMEENWAGADLAALVERALSPYAGDGTERVAADGPPVRLSPQQAVSQTLILHELATNAVKYGALSTPAGRVEVNWNLAMDDDGGRRMTFLWAEHGGPPVGPPTRRGFGTRLIARSFPEGSGGEAHLLYDPQGVRCSIELRLSTEAESPLLDLTVVAAPDQVGG